MLTQRILGVFTFRREVFSEVENDTSFTSTAWLIVAVVSFLNNLGGRASADIGSWILGAIIGTVLSIIGFALAAFIIDLIGRTVFNAKVTFDELVRTLGLAYVWNVVGFLGVLGVISSTLVCLVSPALFVGFILGLIAWFLAVKEALDLEWIQTIVTVVIGWVVLLVFYFITGAILAVLGLAGAAATGALN